MPSISTLHVQDNSKTIRANPIMLPHPEGTCSGVFIKNPCFSKKAKTVLSLVEYLKYFLMERRFDENTGVGIKKKIKKKHVPSVPLFLVQGMSKKRTLRCYRLLVFHTDDKLGV